MHEFGEVRHFHVSRNSVYFARATCGQAAMGMGSSHIARFFGVGSGPCDCAQVVNGR